MKKNRFGTWTKVGNTVFGPNGSVTKVGNTWFGSKGSCTKVGNTYFGDADDGFNPFIFDDEE